MTMNDAYETAVRQGLSTAFVTSYVRLLKGKKSHDVALESAMAVLDNDVGDGLGQQARSAYEREYEGAISSGETEKEARKRALSVAMRISRFQ